VQVVQGLEGVLVVTTAVQASGHAPLAVGHLSFVGLVATDVDADVLRGRSVDPKGTGQARWVSPLALSASAVTSADRMPNAVDLW
jgi:hypothetical protein